MAKRKKVRARRRAMRTLQARGGTAGGDLDEAFEVLGQAQRLYPKLLARREHFAAELAKVEQALARLSRVIGERPRLAPAVRDVPTGTKGPRTLSDLLLSVLKGAKAPMSAADLERGVRAARPGVGTAGLQKALRLLREKRLVEATGKAKRFHYSLAQGAPPTQRAKRGRRAAGGPLVRDVVLSTLAKGGPLGMAELIDAVVRARPDVKKESVTTMVKRLRREGAVKTSGRAGAYRYSTAS